VSDLDPAPAPVGLARRQLATTAWSGLRTEGGSAEEVPSDLGALLLVDDERAEEDLATELLGLLDGEHSRSVVGRRPA
jgi:hypothetical protein